MVYPGYEALTEKVSLTAEDHYAFAVDNKIWFVSRKFHDLPKQNWGQRVAYRGGYVIKFDVSTNEWSEKIEFDKLVQDEDDELEEIVFVHEGKVCILLYERYGQIRFHQLAVFDEKEGAFTMWNEFEDNRTTVKNDEHKVRNDLILADGDLPDKNRLLVASVDGALYLFRLSIDQTLKRASLERTSKHMFDSLLIPIHAAAQGPFAIIEYSNKAACSVMWDASAHQRVIIEQSSEQEREPRTEIKGPAPKFHFSGAKVLSLLDNNRWLHIAGSTLKGMSGSTFRGEVWLLEFPFSNEPQWKQIDGADLPQEAESSTLVFDKKSSSLYVFGKDNGVYKKKIEL